MTQKQEDIQKENQKDEEIIEETSSVDEVKNESEETSEVDPLQEKITELEKANKNLEDKELRLQAEIQNIQQRNARETQALLKYDGQKLAAAILPAVDNMERALDVNAEDEVAQQIKKGVEITLNTLKQALKDRGIEAIGTVGESFDPTKHQAIQSVESDLESAKIAQVLQKGYMLHDRVLRPAMVAVSQ